MNELLASVRAEMVRLAKELPEFETVRAMYGVGDTKTRLKALNLSGLNCVRTRYLP